MDFDYENSLERSDALARLCERWRPCPREETVLLDQAFGRVLARDARAACTLPVVRSSKRDGVAVRSADFANGEPDTAAWREGVEFVRADTGDDFPDAYDAVVAIESVELSPDGAIRFFERVGALSSGDGVNRRGSIVKEGALIARAGTRLSPEVVAACAVGGLAQLSVRARPVVAFLATGSELVPWGSYPHRGQNIEANSLLATGLLRQWGATCLAYPVVADDRDALASALDRALAAADIVVVNGGSSRGNEDFNSELIASRARYFRHGVRAVPGRPVGMALIGDVPVVNVPGPVQAAWLCFDWLVRGLVSHFLGSSCEVRPAVAARLAVPLVKPEAFERLIRVRLYRATDGALACEPLPACGVALSMSRADGLLVLPIGSDGVAAGDEVRVELLRPWADIEGEWASDEPLA